MIDLTWSEGRLCAQLVGTYCRWMIPGLLPFVWSMVIMKVRLLTSDP